jgi:type I restriction enzyme M protein
MVSNVYNSLLIPKYYHWLLNKPPLPDGCEAVRLGDLLDEKIIKVWDGHGSPSAHDKGQGEIPYVRVKDIVNWELYRNPTSGVTYQVWEKFTRGKHILQPGDIIFVRRGSYRIGTIAMASPRDRQVVLTRELLTIRVADPNNKYCLTPSYLLSLLSSKYVYEQCPSLTFMDTTLPNIGDRWKELILPVHCQKDERNRISRKVEQAIILKWKAQTKIDELREQVGDIVT